MDVRDGQYRASRKRGDDQDLRRGKEGWFGSASRTINNSDTPDPGGGHHPAWNDRRMTLMDPDGPRTHMVSQSWGVSLRLKKNRRDCAIPDCASVVVEQNSNLDPLGRPERDGSHQAPLGRKVRAPRRRMRPAGISGPARRVTTERGNHAKRKSAVRPLSVEAVEFSPALVLEQNSAVAEVHV